MSLLRLAFMTVLFTTCGVFFVISLTYIAICSRMAVIMMATVISSWEQGALCVSLLFGFSCVSYNCASAMSHPKSGILLVGTVFLPSHIFPTCSSYSWQTFSVIGIFLMSLWCTLVVWLWLSLISTWLFP